MKTKIKKRDVEEFSYDFAFQERIVRTLYADPDFTISMALPHLPPGCFENNVHRWFAETIIGYAGKHMAGASHAAVKIEADHAYVSGRLVRKRDKPQVDAILSKLKKPVQDRSFIKEELFRFIKNQTFKDMVLNGVEYMKQGDLSKLDGEVQRVLDVQAAASNGLGHFMVGNARERYKKRLSYKPDGIPSGFAWDVYMKGGGPHKKQLAAFVAPPSGGKCHAYGTLVVCHDGSQVAVEDVCVGDKLLGPDGTARTVRALGRGRDRMFRVTPTSALSGDGFVCNAAHILTVRDGYSDAVTDVPIREFLSWSKDRQRRSKLVRPEHGVEFTRRRERLHVDPWLLGLWYAEGTKSLTSVEITNPDVEVEIVLEAHALQLGLRLTKQVDTRTGCPMFRFATQRHGTTNRLLDALRFMVGDAADLPERIVCGTVAERRAFLAGWIDGDGHARGTRGVEIINQHEAWARSLVRIARSVGLRAAVAPKEVKLSGWDAPRTYWRVRLAGDFDCLPIQVPRKAKACEGVRVSDGFTVTQLPRDNYYGFTLDGDHRYLLGDFIVTHNTMSLVNVGKQAIMLGQEQVLHITLELAQEIIEDRYDSCFTGIKIAEVEEKKNARTIRRFWKQLGVDLQGEPLVIKEFPALTITVKHIEHYIRQLERRGFYPGVVIVDYADLLMPEEGLTGDSYEDAGNVYVQLRSLAQRLGVLVWTAGQGNRNSLGKKIITMKELADSFKKAMHADVLIAHCCTEEEEKRHHARQYIMKNRNGISGVEFPIKYDWYKAYMRNR